jgi:nicotinamidase-related amidase
MSYKINLQDILASKNYNDLLALAELENSQLARNHLKKSALLIIDPQKDFMDDGALGVPGAYNDMSRLVSFIYQNSDVISKIAVSLDTHFPQQIFHACWWEDNNGNPPVPFTIITVADVRNGVWKSRYGMQAQSLTYVEALASKGKQSLVIWPYHCLAGTSGHAIEENLSKMIYFFDVTKNSRSKLIQKGSDPLSEMYGIIKAEFDVQSWLNIDVLNFIETSDRIFIAGEAKSHCVAESAKQIVEYFQNRPEILDRLYILEDCMSPVTGFDALADDAITFLKNNKVHVVKSTDFDLFKY